mgnify:CR=1 FL=1
MDIRNTAKQIRFTHWNEIITQCQKSGLTIKAFCQQHNINEKSYFYWQHKIRLAYRPQLVSQSCTPVMAETTFVSLQQPKDMPETSTLIIGCGDFAVTVTEHTSEALLQKTLLVLHKVQRSW